MKVEERNKKYNKYVKQMAPQSKWWPSLIWAFIIGGLICVLGEGIGLLAKTIWPKLDEQGLGSIVSITLIFIAAVTTALGLYDKIGTKAGGGSIVPITGFSNSITSPAIEFRKEGVIKGICAKMFIVAGPVIVIGVASSMLVGLIYFFVGL